MHTFRRLAVYCGSSSDVDPLYLEAAHAMGQHLAGAGVGVVYGGGRAGLMGAVADGALAAGGTVYGVIPDKLQALEVGHHAVTELFVVDSMHARKAMMVHLADGFVALPGGFGTWEEIMEAATLGMLGYHKKPLGLLNVAGYFDHLLAFIAHASAVGFVRPPFRDLLQVADSPGELLAKMTTQTVPSVIDLLRVDTAQKEALRAEARRAEAGAHHKE
ncbi:MAG: TIGR00730 family Rossman fold protein [bacterium]